MKRALPLPFVVLVATACQRKAPGPIECHAFAKQLYGATAPGALADPILRERVSNLTTRCLVTPFDRQLLRCVETTANPSRCQRAFQQRTRSQRQRPKPLKPADDTRR